MDPKWLTIDMVCAIHLRAVARYGGSAEIRDLGLLESALDRPKTLYAYAETPSIHEMAAAYGAGIIRNHPFVDGNKRTGLLAAQSFLVLNRYDFRPIEAEAARIVLALAAGEIDEGVLAAWLSDFTTRKRD